MPPIHDYVIANQTGANTRSDLNNAFSAIVSNNSSATEPTTTYAYQWWADTGNDLLKQRNAADSAWISILTLSTGAVSNAAIADDAVTLAKMAAGTDGELITYDTSGDPTTVPTGSSGEVLTSNGAGTTPTFQTSTHTPDDNSVTLAKMAHGTDGELITYDATGAPANVAVGTSGQVLTSGGVGVAPTFQAAAGGGKVLQVLQDVLDTELSVTLNTTWGAITGLSKAITPSATSSTVLVQVVVNVGGQSSGGESYPKIRLKRGSTSIGVGSGSGSRTLSSAMWSPGSTSINCTGTLTITFLDSPNTTSATTYSVDIFAYNNRSFYINRVSADENTAGGRAISTITLTEVSV